MERQVPQVKRKNSTNCKPPEARLTVRGSVASRLGPREVAMGRAVAGAAWVAMLEGVSEGRGVPSGCELGVMLGSTTICCAVGVAEGAQEATRNRSRLRLVLSRRVDWRSRVETAVEVVEKKVFMSIEKGYGRIILRKY